MQRNVSSHIEVWASLKPFRIAHYEWQEYPSVVCEIEQDGKIGRGESLGVYYLDETEHTMLRQVESVSAQVAAGASRDELLNLLPAGGARNAVDTALWDLEAQLGNTTAWRMAGVEPDPVLSVFTIVIADEPGDMARSAAAAGNMPLLKIKLDADRPVERIAAVREARPDARIVVDVNQGWTFGELQAHAPALAELGVEMIEQPLVRGGDKELEGYDSPVALCADESCLDFSDLDAAANRYQVINVKLDKTGGLTRGLQLANAVRDRGLQLMIGSMCGSSLAMAPHHVAAQLADYADIDGPLLMVNDRLGGLVYTDGMVSLPESRLWGIG